VNRVGFRHRLFSLVLVPGFLSLLCLFISLARPATAEAGLSFDASVRYTYEDNVIGLLSDQQSGAIGGGNQNMPGPRAVSLEKYGQPGSMPTGTTSGTSQSPADYSTTVSAEVGGFTSLGESATIFAKGFASYQAYGTYTLLDTTQGGISAGIAVDLSRAVTARLAVSGTVKSFDDSQRNSTAYGANVSLKEKLSTLFWLRQFADYEDSSADSPLFSYTGIAGGVGAGYSLTAKTSVSIGYSYLVRKYDEPSGTELKTGTTSVGLDRTFGRYWSAGVEYDYQQSKDTLTGATMTNNVYSLAVRFGY
jgi:hypothetical protein